MWPQKSVAKVPPKIMLETLSLRVARMHEMLEMLQTFRSQTEEDEANATTFNPRFLFSGDFPLPQNNLTFSPTNTLLGGELFSDSIQVDDDKYNQLKGTYGVYESPIDALMPFDYSDYTLPTASHDNNPKTSPVEQNPSSAMAYFPPLSPESLPANYRTVESLRDEMFAVNNYGIYNVAMPPLPSPSFSADTFSNLVLSDDLRMITPEPPLPLLSNIHGPKHLPEQNVINDLVHLYLNYIHPYLPIFHKSSLLERTRDPRRMSLCLLNALFANAARRSPNPSLQSLSSEFYKRAVTLLEDYQDQPRLSTVQAALLILKYQERMDRPGFFWRTHANFGLIVRSIEELRLDENANGSWEGEEWEEEERRRVYWTAFVFDRMYWCVSVFSIWHL